MTMITPSYLGETIEYSSLHACRSTLEDPTQSHSVALKNKGFFDHRRLGKHRLYEFQVLCEPGLDGVLASKACESSSNARKLYISTMILVHACCRIPAWLWLSKPGLIRIPLGSEGCFLKHHKERYTARQVQNVAE